MHSSVKHNRFPRDQKRGQAGSIHDSDIDDDMDDMDDDDNDDLEADSPHEDTGRASDSRSTRFESEMDTEDNDSANEMMGSDEHVDDEEGQEREEQEGSTCTGTIREGDAERQRLGSGVGSRLVADEGSSGGFRTGREAARKRGPGGGTAGVRRRGRSRRSRDKSWESIEGDRR